MSHLRHEISGLVDGRLAPEEAEAALEHVVSCEECAALLAAERDFRRRMAEATDVRPSDDLTARLVGLGETEVPPAPTGARAVVERAWEPLSYRPGRRRLAARASYVLAGTCGVLAVLLTLGAVYERTGDPVAMLEEANGESETPLTVAATAEAVGDDADADGTEAALSWLDQQGWVVPDRMPEGADINLVGSAGSEGEEVVVIEVVRDGHTATVVQQRGVLDLEALRGLDEFELGGHEMHSLPGQAGTVVLQCHDRAVLVTSTDDPALVRSIAAAMPATEPGPAVADRIDRGWDTLVEWADVLIESR
ncbi:hypothetical protein [Georgenia deserti]|uniref:Zinc-finger domain-containing protein n=1 Tax=Georgenia deserti TaxID=2093781 RepID=A0ABW4L1I2_9MICO